MIVLSYVCKVFEHDHRLLFKYSREDSNECTLSELQITDKMPSNCLAKVHGQENIPVEIGKHF